MQTSAIHIHSNGGPEVLEVVSVEVGDPAPGELRIRQSAIGLNFSDIYQRRGDHGPYAQAPFPVTLGGQGAGVVDAVGSDVNEFHRRPRSPRRAWTNTAARCYGNWVYDPPSVC